MTATPTYPPTAWIFQVRSFLNSRMIHAYSCYNRIQASYPKN